MPKRTPSVPPLVFVLALAACKTKEPPATTDAGAPPASAAPSAASAPALATSLDDLLHFTDARIGVSSKVDNPRDFAEHVADGRLDTAWNGKTGDLAGGWIGFRVPKETRVRVIELTVGYVAKSKKGEDLFAMNHRIAKVRVTRDGTKILEHTFDPDVRDFQRIVLDAPGGDFKLEVLETKPGTKKEWRELVVSELRVLGVAGAAKRATTSIPHVHVGGFDARPPAIVATKPAPRPSVSKSAVSIDALCKEWLDGPMTAFRALDGGADDTPWPPPEPQCGGHEFGKAGDITVSTIGFRDLRASWSEVGLTQNGRSYAVGASFAEDGNFDPHCGGYSFGKIVGARMDGAELVVEIYRGDVSNPFPSVNEDGSLGEGVPGGVKMQIDEMRCTWNGAAPSCATKTIAKREGPYGEDVETPPPRPWKSR